MTVNAAASNSGDKQNIDASTEIKTYVVLVEWKRDAVIP